MLGGHSVRRSKRRYMSTDAKRWHAVPPSNNPLSGVGSGASGSSAEDAMPQPLGRGHRVKRQSIIVGQPQVDLKQLHLHHGFRSVPSAQSSTLVPEEAKLWSQFNSVGNEMIMTKNGRCLFPTLRFQPLDLDPNVGYSVSVDIVQVSPDKFKFGKNEEWAPVFSGSSESPSPSYRSMNLSKRARTVPSRGFEHQAGIQEGEYWTANGISFAKIKLTNSGGGKENKGDGIFQLQSFHKYIPRIHLVKHAIGGRETTTFTFEETTFIAVTHYQNDKVNSLKKNYNPHAKGFKDQQVKAVASRVRACNLSGDRDALSHLVSPVSSRRSQRLRYSTKQQYTTFSSSDEEQERASFSKKDEDKENAVETDMESSTTTDEDVSDLHDAVGSTDEEGAMIDDREVLAEVRPTPLQLLSMCCSHILEKGDLNIGPENESLDLIEPRSPLHPLDAFALACESNRRSV